ncbi:tRNA pseudouridine(38-40) synthase TruA [Calditrichota bacterium]
MRYSLLIEYDGTSFSGWQIQKHHITIQGEIEKAIQIILKQKIGVIGAGRTDSGVHAKGQVAHFDSNEELNPFQFQRSLNGLLPRDIRIKNCKRETDKFHARFDAVERKYCYYISRKPTALLRHYSWYFSSDLNYTNMQNAADLICGKHNFESFCRSNSEVSNYICEIKYANWSEKHDLLTFIINADRFLHGMVRALVGTMIDLGQNKITFQNFKEIMSSGDRKTAGQAAPAKGLILEQVFY